MVHIKKLEIFGFKSFGFKNTVVKFEPGLVSISGPNGSGKSNILNAIIFATCEDRARVMGADRMRSLVHDPEAAANAPGDSKQTDEARAGSGRRMVGGPRMARCSIHFDNSDRKMPVSSNSVEITREMNENGESLYYLNKKKTQRSNIMEILDVARAGRGQYNIVQQGTITRISELAPEERRRSIEDIIGISSFDVQKEKSMTELDAADRRLEVSLARMGEIKKQIDKLEEERNMKMRYDLIRRDLKRYRAIEAAHRLRKTTAERESLQEELDDLRARTEDLRGRHEQTRKEISSLEDEKSRVLKAADDYTRAQAELREYMKQSMQRHDEAANTISTSEKRLARVESRLGEIEDEMKKISASQNFNSARMREAENSHAEIDAARQALDDELRQTNSERRAILAAQSEAASKRSERDAVIKRLTDKMNALVLEASEHRQKRDNCLQKIKDESDRLAKKQGSIGDLESSARRLESVIGDNCSAINELGAEKGRLERRIEEVASSMREMESMLERSSKLAVMHESKIKTVEKFMYEDYTVAKLREDASNLGIKGLVYELVSWDPAYERPVMAACSDWIKAVVVKDLEALFDVAEAARLRGLRKFRIIPLEAVQNLPASTPEGVTGVLSDFVRCDPRYASLKTFLFGDVVLAEARAAALAASRRGYRAVTMSGEYFEPQARTAIIDIDSKISRLASLILMSGDVDDLFRSLRLLKKHIEKKRQVMRGLENSARSCSEKISDLEGITASAKTNLQYARSQLDSKKKAAGLIPGRISGLEAESAKAASAMNASRLQAESVRKKIDLETAEYEAVDQSNLEARLSESNKKKMDIEARHAEVMGKFRRISSDLADLRTGDSRLKSNRDTLAREAEELAIERPDLLRRKADAQQVESAESQSLVQLRQKEQDLLSTSGSSIGVVRECDAKLDALNGRERSLTKDMHSAERRSYAVGRDLAELKTEEDRLRQDSAGLRPGDADDDFDVEAAMRGLEAEFDSLPDLNAKAPENYLLVTDGYRSMSARKNSLEKERASIVRFIEGIEKEKRQTFLDAFDQVDAEIHKIFGQMTGGDAWLELQNEDDIFESGISYLVQFPQKSKRESTSISGGEKTLAAVVFILALQKLQPSSFYLFDEVDAHLDEPNSERLANILVERSREGQFIMVSLKAPVVDRANLVHGVFPRRGVSQVIPYKDRRAPQAEAAPSS